MSREKKITYIINRLVNYPEKKFFFSRTQYERTNPLLVSPFVAKISVVPLS